MSDSNPTLEALLAEATWLQRLALHLVGDADRAADAVQETLAIATRRHGDGVVESPRGWLRGILTRVLQRDRRDARHRGDREFQWSESRAIAEVSTESITSRMELQAIVGEEVAKLPEPYRSTLFQHYYEGRAFEEIASASGERSGTVRARAKRARELLREALVRRDGRSWNEWQTALAPVAGLTRVFTSAHATTASSVSVASVAAVAACVALVGFGVVFTWGGVTDGRDAETLSRATDVPSEPAAASDVDAPPVETESRSSAGATGGSAAVSTSTSRVLAGGRLVSDRPEEANVFEGASVRFVRPNDEPVEATIDEGRWSTTALTPGAWTLEAHADAHASITRTIDVPNESAWRFDIELPYVDVIPVRIVTSNGEPLPKRFRDYGAEEGALTVIASVEPIPTNGAALPWFRVRERRGATWVPRGTFQRSLVHLPAKYLGEIRLNEYEDFHVALLYGGHVIERTNVSVGSGEVVLRVDLDALEDVMGTVRVRVHRDDDGEGRGPGFSARLRSMPNSYSATPGADGVTELRVPPGRMELELKERGELAIVRNVDLAPGEVLDLGDVTWSRDAATYAGSEWSVEDDR